MAAIQSPGLGFMRGSVLWMVVGLALGCQPLGTTEELASWDDADAVAIGRVEERLAEAPLARRPVHERARWVEHRDLERRGGAAPVRDDVPDGEALPPRLDVPQPPSLTRDRDLDPSREVPPRPPLPELHDPRPHPLGRGGEGGGAVDDHPGVGHDVVARPRRRHFLVGHTGATAQPGGADERRACQGDEQDQAANRPSLHRRPYTGGSISVRNV